MREYFAKKMGMGRYPDKTIAEVFSNDRRYFDQILYKNAKFRAEYAKALEQWIKTQEENGVSHGHIDLNRILLAIEITGEDKVISLFKKLIEVLNAEWPDKKLPEDIDYKATLDGKYNGLEGYGPQLKRIQTFWERLAIPTVW
ncbi:hypothetical protein [Desulfallas thermosapovorans]|uniref:Uncharacterized protein n=1 Tax=Desulfallas thermosapovorans DSM 6562 TaxID=1121431 RepID=A0A5S4ZW87_9FIRM|nr:hypothetical protein [Desulfallas thermosapovorans]TYO97056.1 hypothetical protein LX24_00874 [Desulfallas thermosapovorans DSM 6562]